LPFTDVDLDCSKYPDEAQLGNGLAIISGRTSLWVCYDGPLGEGIPHIRLAFSGAEEDNADLTANLVWWGRDDVFRSQQTGNNISNSKVVYDLDRGFEFRVGLQSAGFPPSASITLDSLTVTDYYEVSKDPAEVLLNLDTIKVYYEHLKDPETVTHGKGSRSALAEHFHVPDGWEVDVFEPPRYQRIWGIFRGDGNGYFLFQNNAPTKTGVQDAIRYVSFQGEDICAATMSDMGRNLPIYSVIEGPGGSVLARTNQGLLLQVYPYPQTDAKDSVIQEGLPVCSYEKYAVIGGGLEPLALAEGGVVAYDPDTKSIFLIPKGEGRSGADPIASEFLVASGFGRVFPDSAVLLPGNKELIVWDFITGLHKIDLDTGQDIVLYHPRDYQDTLSLNVYPNSNKLYFFEATGTLYSYSLTNGGIDVVSEETECIWHPEASFIKSDGSALIGTDRATGSMYLFDFRMDEVTYLLKPVNTSALDVADDGTIFAGYTGCQGNGYVKKIGPDGSTTLFSENLPVQIRKLKTHNDLVYVLGINGLGWEILDPELTVLNQTGQVEYSVDLPSKSYDNLSVLQNGNALLCDHWRNSCVEAGRDGVIREFTVNFNGADQPMSMTNQAPDGSIYAYLGFYRGIVKGEPTVDRFIMAFDLETRTFAPLFQTQWTGTSGSVITLDSYATSNSDLGFFFITGPVPMVAYHVSPEGLDYLRSDISSNNVPSLKTLLGKEVDNIPIIEVTARGLPQDAWGIGANTTIEGHPYVVIASAAGYLQFYEKP